MKHEIGRRCIKRMRIKIADEPGALGAFTTRLGELGIRFGEITTASVGRSSRVRDVDVIAPDEATFDRVCDEVRAMDQVDLLEVTDVVRERHLGGKIATRSRVELRNLDDLGIVYTPGVASMCLQIADDPELASRYTAIANTVAIVTNGTAILGLGDIGPVAGMPVMEGKAALFDLLAGVSGVPILIDSKDPDVIVDAITAIAPTFGAIKLEDIRAPECFEIEERLGAALDIPVLHDDQHGTAVVVLAALLNIAQARHLNLKRARVGIVGLGAAGSGIQRLLAAYGVQTILGVDISPRMVERFEALGGRPTDLAGVMAEADMVIATTGVPGLIKPETVRPKQVILALSNPDPEIDPDAALAAGAAFAADGKAVNNALAFPGLFRGALDARATRINDGMKIAAAREIAARAPEGELTPPILDRELHRAVAAAVREAALTSGDVRYSRRLEV
ncbi:MAG TPA: malic enzyme-like NAD(P)-binding protein [Methylomirabilota bacterium]|nr:malic enzyme-like NAD(P)-binding protein [Methylomirabilota bacterium]